MELDDGMKSTIADKSSGMGGIVNVPFEKRIVIAYCSSIRIYANLYGDKDLARK